MTDITAVKQAFSLLAELVPIFQPDAGQQAYDEALVLLVALIEADPFAELPKLILVRAQELERLERVTPSCIPAFTIPERPID